MSVPTVVTLLLGGYHLLFLVLAVVLAATGLRAARHRARLARVVAPAALRDPADALPVSVVVPAYDEEDGVLDCVRSALAARHPEVEVVVVDDGSRDRTLDVLRDAFGLVPVPYAPDPDAPPLRGAVREVLHAPGEPRLIVVVKANGGKADACNAGLALARHPWVVVTDADSVLHPDAFAAALAAAAEDPERIVGVGGQLGIANGGGVVVGDTPVPLPRHRVERFQALEYLSVFLAERPGWSRLGAVPVVSGGFGAWRRDVLLAVGGYSTRLTHEDIELTWRMHRRLGADRVPYRIHYLHEVAAWTEVPGRWRDLYLQRKRWQRVVLETVWHYRRVLFNPRHRAAGLVAMPYLLLYEALGPFVEVAAWGAAAVLLATGLLDGWLLLCFLAASFGTIAALRLLPMALGPRAPQPRRTRGAVLRLGLLALLEYPLYHLVILAARLLAAVEAARGRRTWERVARARRPAGSGAPA